MLGGSPSLMIHHQRATLRKLSIGSQALLAVAYLRKGETYADPACGFAIGTSTVYRYIRKAIGLLAAMASAPGGAPYAGSAARLGSGHVDKLLSGDIRRPVAGSKVPG